MKMLMFVTYRPGKVRGGGFKRLMESLSMNIDMAQESANYPVVMGFGDYNFPDLSWTTGMLPATLETIDQEIMHANELLKLMKDHLLFQHITHPTRKKNILDLLLLNNTSVVESYSQCVNVNLSDHNTNTKNETLSGQKKGTKRK